MRCLFQNSKISAILFICLLFLSACTGLTRRLSENSKIIYSSSEAKAILSMLERQNRSLKTFKGLGRITFLGKDEKGMITRIAWIAAAPDKMRVTLNSVSGQPVVSAASDGQWFYFFSHIDGDFYKKRATNSNMKRFFSISIKSEDIVNILAGRVPVENYDSPTLFWSNTVKGLSEKGFQGPSLLASDRGAEGNKITYVLVLKSKWGNVREKVYLKDNKKDVYKIEMFDSTGGLVYAVEFNRMQKIKDYWVPSQLRVSNGDGEGFLLCLDRYWVDAMVSPSVFTLIPPK